MEGVEPKLHLRCGCHLPIWTTRKRDKVKRNILKKRWHCSFLILALTLSGCLTNLANSPTAPHPQVVKVEKDEKPSHSPPVNPTPLPPRDKVTTEIPSLLPSSPLPEPPKETIKEEDVELKELPAQGQAPWPSDQELLDSALEFCQASYDYWEQGDLDNALDALDQAYSLILKVESKAPQIVQQKDDLRVTISKRIIEVYSSRFTVVNGNRKAIPMVMNHHVKRAIKLFQGPERRFFLNSYRRSGRYRPLILKALKEAGLPEELSWLPLIESGFKVKALSRARALGLWQFIASTGYKYGLKRDRWVDERMDVEKSTQAAIQYLKELHQIFGDWLTVLAAYNCGEGRVLKAIRTQRINYLDNFWDLYEILPMETAFYVPKFLAALHILNDPEAYGFELPTPQEPPQVEKVTIDKPMHLKTIAKHLGISYSLLKELNPELKRNSTPDRPYDLKLPLGKGTLLLAKLTDIPVWKPPVTPYVIHRVRRGETLSHIARRYRTSIRAIMQLNGLRSSRFIRAGWKLKVPTRYYSFAPNISNPPTLKEKKSVPPLASGSFRPYVVKKGDSLWKIARRFNTTTKALKKLNNLKGTHLRIGQLLYIPPKQLRSTPFRTKRYVVEEGDSPFMIAQKHQMNLAEFLKLNNLTPRSTIFPGQELLVKAE